MFLTISEAYMKKRDGRKQLWVGALVGSRQTVVTPREEKMTGRSERETTPHKSEW